MTIFLLPSSQRLTNATTIGLRRQSRMSSVYLYGYTRGSDGSVVNYHRISVANTIHKSSGSGNNTDQFVGIIHETL